MERLPRKIKIPECPGQKGPEFIVPRSDIDNFGHMNNSKYIVEAENLLPDGFEAERIRLEFKIALMEGEMVTPIIYEDGENVTVAMFGSEKNQQGRY